MNQTPSLHSIHRLVWTALLAALTAVGAIISIPIIPLNPVPVSLQTLFVSLSGLILGPRHGAMAMLLYLAAGCLGLPIFTGGKAGFAVLLGPTGGFALAFVPAAALCGLAGGGVGGQTRSFIFIVAVCACATALTLLAGSLQLALIMDISFYKALFVGAVPFIPGGVAKCLAAAAIYRLLAARKLLPK